MAPEEPSKRPSAELDRPMPDAMKFALLLTISNTFMTMAWYGHLKHRSMALWPAILMSWGIAFAEYVFQVPANRIGSWVFSLTQLKLGRECNPHGTRDRNKGSPAGDRDRPHD